MRIFHNFDTELKDKEYQDSVDKYGKAKTLLLQRCAAYWYVKGYLVVFFYLLVVIGLIFIIYLIYNIHIALLYFGLFIIFLLSITMFRHALNTYLHYKLDFTIVTPDEIITYEQKGILDSSYKSFPVGKIRSIKSARTGLLGNIFGYGDIVFVTDGSSELAHPDGEKYGSGKMTLTYVFRPNVVKKEIMDIAYSGHSKESIEPAL